MTLLEDFMRRHFEKIPIPMIGLKGEIVIEWRITVGNDRSNLIKEVNHDKDCYDQ